LIVFNPRINDTVDCVQVNLDEGIVQRGHEGACAELPLFIVFDLRINDTCSLTRLLIVFR
jgi:hypothetical protein